MMHDSFLQIYSRSFFKPWQSFSELLHHPKSLAFGFYAVFIQAILYTCVYGFLILGGGQAFKPWLNIPVDVYYQYNVFFCGPTMFLGWILATGLIHVLLRTQTQQGQFEQLFCLLGFGISIASWATGIHDFCSSFLGAIHIIDQRSYEIQLNSPGIWRNLLWFQMLVYLLWFIFLFTTAVRIVYQVNRFRALAFGVLAFLVYQLFFLIFNR